MFLLKVTLLFLVAVPSFSDFSGAEQRVIDMLPGTWKIHSWIPLFTSVGGFIFPSSVGGYGSAYIYESDGTGKDRRGANFLWSVEEVAPSNNFLLLQHTDEKGLGPASSGIHFFADGWAQWIFAYTESGLIILAILNKQ